MLCYGELVKIDPKRFLLLHFSFGPAHLSRRLLSWVQSCPVVEKKRRKSAGRRRQRREREDATGETKWVVGTVWVRDDLAIGYHVRESTNIKDVLLTFPSDRRLRLALTLPVLDHHHHLAPENVPSRRKMSRSVRIRRGRGNDRKRALLLPHLHRHHH